MKTTSPTRRSGLRATQCTTFIVNKNGERVQCRHSVLPGTESCSAGHKNTSRLVPVIDSRTPVSGVAVLDGTLHAEDLPGFLVPDSQSTTSVASTRAEATPSERALQVSRRAAQVAVGAFALGAVAFVFGL